MPRGPLVVVGDSLLDLDIDGTADRLCPDAPVPVVDVTEHTHRPGGAGLAAVLAARTTGPVTALTGLGADAAGEALGDVLSAVGELVTLPYAGTTPCKTRVRAGGRSIVRYDSGDGRVLDEPISARVVRALRGAGAVLVADYGRGASANRSLRRTLSELPSEVPVVWDPHPKGAEPPARCDLVVPNHREAAHFAGSSGDDPERLAEVLRQRWSCGAVAVTAGEEGAFLAEGAGTAQFTDERRAPASCDVCGAGDSFAVAVALGLRSGMDRRSAVAEAVHTATGFVVDGAAGSLGSSAARERAGAGELAEFPGLAAPVQQQGSAQASAVVELRRRVRERGGRIVATGGCFDLLHPGHVSLLRRARALGDVLIVCLNSDDSVRRLKGPERPLVRERDRLRMLEALEPVDAVVVFDEDSPAALLESIRPDVWVKGGDYDAVDLPESDVVHRHGGRVELLPLEDGHSTSGLLSTLRAVV